MVAHHEEERHARSEALRHALERIDDLADEGWVRPEDVEQLRDDYRRRGERHARRAVAGRDTTDAHKRLHGEVLRAERRALIRLRDEGAISDEVMQRLEEELDVEALRIGVGDA